MDEKIHPKFVDVATFLGQLSAVTTQQAVITERLTHVIGSIANVQSRLEKYDARIQELEHAKFTWKGAGLMFTAMGAILMALITAVLKQAGLKVF